MFPFDDVSMQTTIPVLCLSIKSQQLDEEEREPG